MPPGLRFRRRKGADVHVVADFHFARGDIGFGMKAEALAVHHEAHVRADLAVGPEVERFLDDQIADAIVAFDQARDLRGGFGGGDVFFRLRGRREEAHARHVLREHGDER